MSYNKTQWTDNQTPLSAQNLNKMENGIEKANNDLTSHKAESAIHKTSQSIREESATPLRVEVTNSFPSHADGKIIAHLGEKKAFVSIGGEWV